MSNTVDARRLIHQLYRDINRLERALSDGVELVKYLGDHINGKTIYDHDDEVVSQDTLLGWAGQFLDTHEKR
jgi:hypothetical protein